MDAYNLRQKIILVLTVIVFLLCFPAVISLYEKPDLPIVVKTSGNSVLVHSLKAEIPGLNPGDRIVSIDDILITSRENIEVIMDLKNAGDPVLITFISGDQKKETTAAAIHFYSSHFIIFQAATAFIFMLFGLFVFIKSRASKPGELFHLANLGVAVVLVMTWGKISRSFDIGYIVRMLFHSAYILTPLLFLHFSLSFPEDLTKKYKKYLLILYSTGIILVLMNIYAFLNLADSPGSAAISRYISFFNGGRAFLTFCVIASVSVFFTGYFQTKDTVQRKKLKWLITGFLIGPLSFIFLWVIPQAITDYGLIPEEYLSLLMLSVPLTFSISILKYHLLDIDIILNRSIVYSFAAALIIAVYISIVLAVTILTNANQMYISAITAVLIAFLFHPIKDRLMNFINRKFFRVQYNFREAVKKVFSEMQEINDIKSLSEKVISGIRDLIPAEKIAMIDVSEINNPRVMHSDNFTFSDFDFLYKNILNRHSMSYNIFLDEKTETGAVVYENEKRLKEIKISGIVTSVPVDNRIQAILAVGNKKSGQKYTPEDIDLLQNIINTASSFIARLKLQEDLLRKNIEAEKLTELNRQKSLFVSSVSHDLRTPLTSIKMYSELIKMNEAAAKDKINYYAAYIEGESDRLTRLIDNVLNFSRIEKGIKEYFKQPVDLAAILKKAAALMEYELKVNNFILIRDIPDEELIVYADSDSLTQVFLNLINNAVKYSGSSREIKLCINDTELFYNVMITDYGIGISADDLENLFNPFFRAGQVQQMRISGTGLGLSIIKHIADAHDIEIKISSSPGAGTTFNLLIPKYIQEYKNEEHPVD